MTKQYFWINWGNWSQWLNERPPLSLRRVGLDKDSSELGSSYALKLHDSGNCQKYHFVIFSFLFKCHFWSDKYIVWNRLLKLFYFLWGLKIWKRFYGFQVLINVNNEMIKHAICHTYTEKSSRQSGIFFKPNILKNFLLGVEGFVFPNGDQKCRISVKILGYPRCLRIGTPRPLRSASPPLHPTNRIFGPWFMLILKIHLTINFYL